MPHLIGIVGQLNKSQQAQKLLNHFKQMTIVDSANIISNDCGTICAGFKYGQDNISDRIMPLICNNGIFIGKLFNYHNSQPTIFNAFDSQIIINNPKIILKQWWGRYIGVLYNNKTKVHTLIRDPQGLSTLFYYKTSGGVIFSTDLACLYDCLEEKPSIDLNYFAKYVVNKDQASELMPFFGIKELLPGMALHIYSDGSISHEQLWDICSLKGTFIKNTKEFEEELLTTLRSCMKAWVGDSNNICVELSGGADSSAVMIVLRDILPNVNIIGVNYFDSKTPSSNEIEYAQEVADICNAQLKFIDWQDISLMNPLPENLRHDKPTNMLLFPKVLQMINDIGKQNNCTEFMNGQGGDHVFLAPQPIEAIADYWLDRGFVGIMQPLNELSCANKAPWSLLIKNAITNIAKYYGKKEKNIITPTPFINPDFKYTYKDSDFYLKNALANFYPGKIQHIESINHAVAYAERYQTMPNYITTHPLLSQPIVELALKVPTYQSFGNGFDRILFRNAVSKVNYLQIKKPKALWRNIKGQTTGSMNKLFSKNASDIYNDIVDSTLVASGLINKVWLEAEMINIRHGKIDNLWPIIQLLTAQRWLEQWKL